MACALVPALLALGVPCKLDSGASERSSQ